MLEKPCILGVDDDAINQLVLTEFLGDDYNTVLCSDGPECLSYLENKTPDVILMDVSMPGISGLETCEKLRKMPNCSELPVIFVSALASKEDKIAGYQAGGDDYLTKPFEESELKNKIELLLKNKERTLELKASSDEAFKTAMLSMTNAGELGVVIEFLKQTYQAQTPQQLAQLAIDSLAAYGHQGSVLLMVSEQSFFVTSDEGQNIVEQKVMERAKDKGRIIEYGTRVIFNGKNASLLVRNMPFDDERTGRLRDHLAIILDGLEARLNSLTLVEELDHSQNVNHHVKDQALVLLDELKQSHKDQHFETATIFNTLHDDLENIYHQLKLTEEEEVVLNDFVTTAGKKINNLLDIGLSLDQKLELIIRELDN